MITSSSTYQLDALLDSSIRLMRTKEPNLFGPVATS